jgi:monoamine oxidase
MDADAIVIGAGAAGLAAARRLAARGQHVVLLEARDRVGGRAFSVPTGRALTPAELGAEFIHGPGEATLALLREDGMASVDVGDEGWSRTADGLQRDENDFFEVTSIFEAVDSLDDDETVDAFLRRFDADAPERERASVARGFVEGFDAADPAIASVRAIAQEWESGTDWRSARPVGGYAALFAHLRSRCIAAGAELHLCARVTRIAWEPGEVAVETTDARGTVRTFRGRSAIVTLPAGVLREGSVRFDPALPASKRAALAKIEMGDVVKVVLVFRTAFWERIAGARFRDATFFRTESLPFHAYWTQVPLRAELVVAWVGGPDATAMSGVSLDDRIERAREGFGALLDARDEALREFETGFTHDWRTDPFANGAYSYLIVGGADARAALAEPLDATLFFAGEATSSDDQSGTVNGALETGQRAAREVEACLKRRS